MTWPSFSVPYTCMVNQVLSALNPRDRSGPKSQGHGDPAGQAARFPTQIGDRRGEGVVMSDTVSHQDESGVVRHLRPFMEIEGNRIRAFDAIEARCNVGSQYRQRAIGAIDVEPQIFLLCEIGYRRQRIDCTYVNRAGGGGDEEWLQAGSLVGGNRAFQQLHVHFVVRIHRDDAKCVGAYSGQVYRLRDAAMCAGGGIGGQASLVACDSLATHLCAERPLARYPYSNQVGHGGAGHE